METPEFIYRKDGQGQYLWDPFLWILAAGVVALVAGAILLMDHFTPPALGHHDDSGQVMRARHR